MNLKGGSRQRNFLQKGGSNKSRVNNICCFFMHLTAAPYAIAVHREEGLTVAANLRYNSKRAVAMLSQPL